MRRRATVTKDSFYYIVVSGAAAGPSPFQLTVKNTAPPA